MDKEIRIIIAPSVSLIFLVLLVAAIFASALDHMHIVIGAN